MKKYRTIGILGGMGPEATAELYLRIIRKFQVEKGAKYDDDFPEIIIVNLPIPDVVANQKEQNKVRLMLIEAATKLESAGADFIAVPCNTVAYYITEMQKAVLIPIINLLQETAQEVKKYNISKVGLLATETTINENLYASALDDVELITLDDSGKQNTTKIIMNILSGLKLAEDRKTLAEYIEQLKYLGAEKIILGCTDLPLLMDQNSYVIDTLDVLANATFDLATKQELFRKSTNTGTRNIKDLLR